MKMFTLLLNMGRWFFRKRLNITRRFRMLARMNKSNTIVLNKRDSFYIFLRTIPKCLTADDQLQSSRKQTMFTHSVLVLRLS